MRILVTTDQWSPDVVGGSARVAADTARALARRGHEVLVLAPEHAQLPAHAYEDGVDVHRVVRRGLLPQTLGDVLATRRQGRLLRDRGFDVALSHQATNGAGLTLSGLGIPVAAVFHASAVLEMRFLRARVGGAKRAAAYALDPALVALEHRWVRSAAAILVLSEFSRGLVVDRHPSAAPRLHVVGGGVDERFFASPAEPADALRARLGIPPGPLLLTARRLEPRMGVDVLVEALSRVRDERLVLVVTGDGALRPELDALAARRGVGDRVRLVGRVSEEDLRGLYAASSLFVLPTVAYEGFGMSTVEALAQGTPVLGTAVGATPEILGALGPEFVVPAAEPDALAAGIERVLPTLGPELRARAAALARGTYHWDEAIVRWERALQACLRVDGRPPAANL